MAKSIQQYFRLLPKAQGFRPVGRLWYPAADVYQTQDGWVVKVELAGVSFDELEIKIEGETLLIEGCRRDSLCTETVYCHQLEITYSRFEKTIQFPCPIESATVEQDYRDGLLILRLRSPQECE
ncbi:MAG TPA: Hsp20/alpha crystallin family protein [Pyrinomonadaceae bacterium]|jgi:HSP20 family protein|nr:Hsp20/alpha crystallin family protein [Pyrinomonadaceae bacterium]